MNDRFFVRFQFRFFFFYYLKENVFFKRTTSVSRSKFHVSRCFVPELKQKRKKMSPRLAAKGQRTEIYWTFDGLGIPRNRIICLAIECDGDIKRVPLANGNLRFLGSAPIQFICFLIGVFFFRFFFVFFCERFYEHSNTGTPGRTAF